MLAISSAQPNSGAIVQHDFVFAILGEFEPLHALKVHDARSMHAAEQVRIQILLQFGHASAQQMSFCSNVQASVVIGGFDPIDLGSLQEANFSSAPDYDALEARGSKGLTILNRPDSLLRPVEGQFKPGVVERLEQIVECSRFESPQRILVVGSHENSCARQILSQHFQHVEAIAFRHLHVEKQQIRPQSPDCFHGLRARPALRHNFNLWIAAREHEEIAARQRFIIDDNGAYLSCAQPVAPAAQIWTLRLRPAPDFVCSLRTARRRGLAAACEHWPARFRSLVVPIPVAAAGHRCKR